MQVQVFTFRILWLFFSDLVTWPYWHWEIDKDIYYDLFVSRIKNIFFGQCWNVSLVANSFLKSLSMKNVAYTCLGPLPTFCFSILFNFNTLSRLIIQLMERTLWNYKTKGRQNMHFSYLIFWVKNGQNF